MFDQEAVSMRVGADGTVPLSRRHVDLLGPEIVLVPRHGCPLATLFDCWSLEDFRFLTRNGAMASFHRALMIRVSPEGHVVLPGLADRALSISALGNRVTIRLAEPNATRLRASGLFQLKAGSEVLGFLLPTFHANIALPLRFLETLRLCTRVAVEVDAKSFAARVPELLASPTLGPALRRVAEISRTVGFQGSFMDLDVASAAESAGLPVSALESVEDQIRTLEALAMRAHSGNADDGRLQTMLSLFLDLDLEGLLAFAEPFALATACGRARHGGMLAKMSGLMEKDVVMVAVGALHLPGPDGLLELLAQRGNEAQPLRM